LISLIVLLAAPILFAQEPTTTLPLWPKGAPGSEGQTSAEVVKDVSGNSGILSRQVSNIHNPSLIVYLPPKEKANGAAIIIAPGGGHQFLSIDLEGHEIARWLNTIGVAGIVLKYRLAKSPNSPYSVDDAQADGLRSVRVVRAHAKEWAIDPARIGFMGFSAGGEVASRVETHFDKGNPNSSDPVERESSRPDFAILGYPGTQASSVHILADTPPTFLVQAYDDRIGSERAAEYFLLLKKANVPAELHIYRRGGHGFGIRDRKVPTSTWPARLVDWMADSGYLKRNN
jgi:endo-1,4-beta-xylanase